MVRKHHTVSYVQRLNEKKIQTESIELPRSQQLNKRI